MFNDERFVSRDTNVKVPAHLNFGKFMLNNLRPYGDEVAIENADTGETLTYRQIKQYAVDLAVGLSQLGVAKGDVVALGSEKRKEYFAIALAIMFTGATYTPYEMNGKSVLKHQIGITKPKYLICSTRFWETNIEVLRSCESVKTIITLDDGLSFGTPIKSLTSKHHNVELYEPAPVLGQTDTAFILYSSGTTGMPKGVQLTHLNCILSSSPEDFARDESLKTALITLSWYHNYNTFMSFKFLSLGRKIVYGNESARLTMGSSMEGRSMAMLRNIETHKINVAFLAPTLISIISKLDDKVTANLESLKLIYSRSSPLHAKTIQKLKVRFSFAGKVLQGYGMTESGEPCSEIWGSKGPKPGSVGSPSPGTTIKIVNPDTQEVLGANQRGEIRVRGPYLMKGYIGVDPATVVDEEGFFMTGDLGYYDEDEYFYIVERIKDVIMHRGFNVAPMELETILLLHQDVKEVGVVGKPDPLFVEIPTAFVVRQPGSTVTEQQLHDFLKDEVPEYMQLRGGIHFISEIPRNLRGKIIRNKLREMLKEE